MGERRDLRDLLRDTDYEQRRIIDDLARYRDDQSEKDIAKDVRRGGASDFIKNLFVGLFLIGIVIGSFWISFLVGKRVLVPPIKNIPTIEFPKPNIITPLQIKKAEVIPSMKAEEPSARTQVKTVASKPATVPIGESMPSVAEADKYFKVIAGTYSSSGSAKSMANSLTQKGVACFVKKVSSSWRVQVGAFKTKTQAQTLVSRLSAKGISSTIVYE